MIVDSSALIAILFAEPDAALYAQAIQDASARGISAVNYVETAAVIEGRRNPVASARFDELMREASIRVETVDGAQADLARQAYRAFGKASGHPAQLNLGDCFAYALARHRNEPLLFKGNDFSQTDIAAVLPSGSGAP